MRVNTGVLLLALLSASCLAIAQQTYVGIEQKLTRSNCAKLA
jgi:hypothetical protein